MRWEVLTALGYMQPSLSVCFWALHLRHCISASSRKPTFSSAGVMSAFAAKQHPSLSHFTLAKRPPSLLRAPLPARGSDTSFHAARACRKLCTVCRASGRRSRGRRRASRRCSIWFRNWACIPSGLRRWGAICTSGNRFQLCSLQFWAVVGGLPAYRICVGILIERACCDYPPFGGFRNESLHWRNQVKSAPAPVVQAQPAPIFIAAEIDRRSAIANPSLWGRRSSARAIPDCTECGFMAH